MTDRHSNDKWMHSFLILLLYLIYAAIFHLCFLLQPKQRNKWRWLKQDLWNTWFIAHKMKLKPSSTPTTFSPPPHIQSEWFPNAMQYTHNSSDQRPTNTPIKWLKVKGYTNVNDIVLANHSGSDLLLLLMILSGRKKINKACPSLQTLLTSQQNVFVQVELIVVTKIRKAKAKHLYTTWGYIWIN